MAFEDLLESVSEKFKSASKFFNNANMAISFDGRDLSAEEEKRILDVISDVSELNIVCVLDENNNMKEIYEDAVKKAIASVDIDQGFHQLDEILTKLSSEEIKLPEAVKLYTEGVNLVKQCKDSLDKVEKELIVLEENGEEHEL